MSGKLRDWCVYYAHVNEHDVELESFPLQSVRRYGSWHGHNAMVAKHAPRHRLKTPWPTTRIIAGPR